MVFILPIITFLSTVTSIPNYNFYYVSYLDNCTTLYTNLDLINENDEITIILYLNATFCNRDNIYSMREVGKCPDGLTNNYNHISCHTLDDSFVFQCNAHTYNNWYCSATYNNSNVWNIGPLYLKSDSPTFVPFNFTNITNITNSSNVLTAIQNMCFIIIIILILS